MQTALKERINEKAATTSEVDKKPLRFELLALPNTALLTIETFDDGAMEKAGQNFSQFLKTTFQELAEKKIQDLIIDLRGNDGGANLGPVLFSYLTDKEFRFVDRIEVSTDKPSSILNYTQLSADFLKGFAASLTSDNKGRYKVKVESEPTLAPQNPQADAYRNRVWFIINCETFSSTAMFCDIARSQRRGAFVGEETGGDYFGNSAGEFISPRREYSTQSRKAWVEMRGALVATLLFDVLPQYFDSHPACTNQAVGAMPEYRLPVDAAQMRPELLADEPGSDSFQVVDQLTQLNRRVRLKKQVDVISFAIELDQFGTPFLKRLLKDHSQSFEHLLGDRFTAIFSCHN